MSHWILCCSLSVLAWTVTLFGFSYSVIYTSSQKIEYMVLQEEQILNDLQTAVNELGNETVTLSFNRFYQQRIPKVRQRRHDEHLMGYLRHPNGIYHSIKQFAAEYENIRSILQFTLSPSVSKHLSFIAAKEDITGARTSILRLQIVYSLNTSEIVKGNYLGVAGPALGESDMLDIAETAFNGGTWQYAIAWFQEALELSRPTEPTAGFIHFDVTSNYSTGRVIAMLGRAYLRQGNKHKAAEMYRKARSAAFESDEHIIALENELESAPQIETSNTNDKNFGRLCYQQHKWAQKTFDPRLTCSYKETILPYYRFKQEMVSVSPYVALFYEVITDQEIDSIITVARQTLYRAAVRVNGSAVESEIRVSDISFVTDYESPLIGGLSKRVAAITNLNTSPYQPGKALDAEPFQVVNYGMGGHYGFHYDFFDNVTKRSETESPFTNYGGNRLATFLIYLTDVERGGSTVFDRADLAVSPVKKMAVYWYSFKPSGETDTNTSHAGCPVVVGHKWVANKWMWVYGNTFTRRCGLTPDATQLDIEPFMRKGWV